MGAVANIDAVDPHGLVHALRGALFGSKRLIFCTFLQEGAVRVLAAKAISQITS